MVSKRVTCLQGHSELVKMFKPLGAGQWSWWIQCFSILSLKERALLLKVGRKMKSKMLIITSTIPLWSVCEKWSPTASVCFLCMMLKTWEMNLCAIEFLVCHTYCFLQVLQMMQYTKVELLQVMLYLQGYTVDVVVHWRCNSTENKTGIWGMCIFSSVVWKRNSWTVTCGLVSPLWGSDQ